MTAGPGYGYGYGSPGGGRWMTGAEYARMRVCDADRERTADTLRAAFVEGRLNQDELDERLGLAYTARTYADLAAQTADLPGSQRQPAISLPHTVAPMPVTNGMAIGSFVCGVLQLFTLGLTAIPAVILGHAARRQIRRTGQRGDGFALTGLVFGWVGIAFVAILLIGMAAAIAHTSGAPTSSGHGSVSVPGGPPPQFHTLQDNIQRRGFPPPPALPPQP